ncbi:similar to Saccharomyces cerevisiae YHR139C SPS100 Protein required for spore wall maturation [Maudiozyma saulgeensis]|uniref:Similar to Saccharomyces cerevisiae YHR139C SPS100 Protein required for spore wall maturation n=1 Tax=Maudiozyma saulgeensis TaxID=1789683 RepID=A0A1X7R2G5_9SACH|nr:similar to Saccharomyces cerevisiae YHR139C SPS100 Protein required for spore wall maturation [Kazachstania saulgeensis]
MKFSVALTALLAASSAVDASPISFLRKKHSAKASSTTSTQVIANSSNSTSFYNSSNSTVVSNSSNLTNSTHNSTSSVKLHETIQVYVTGGHVSLENSTKSSSNYTTLLNQTSALNITQLYDVATAVNSTLAANETKGTVIITSEKNLEALGFFAAVVFNSSAPVVVGTDAAQAYLVANNTGAANRGALVVDVDGVIYSGVYSPSLDQAASSIPVGTIDDKDSVTWFFQPSLPSFIAEDSILRTNYTNFTNTNPLEYSIVTPLVPIVYDGGYSEDLINSVASTISGLVVISSGASTNSSTSQLAAQSIPVVYTETSPLNIVSEGDVPEGAIGGGSLTPVKAQVFLGIAIANDVADSTSIANLLN